MYTTNGLVNYLLARGYISRTDGSGYVVNYRTGFRPRMQRRQIVSMFGVPAPGYSNRYRLNSDRIVAAFGTPIRQATTSSSTPQLRRLERHRYHSNTTGEGQRTFVSDALARITPDDDGVKRSFGIEYEIYSLTPAQENELAGILDTMPTHVVESDASLSSSGVEIVFAPVDAQTYIKVVTTLSEFIRRNNIDMRESNGGAGMHTTYGVDNAVVSKTDLQIRLNRVALGIKALSTQIAIKKLFGRDFGYYRTLPGYGTYDNALLTTTHANAFSTNGRPANCWECRLVSWNCNPTKMVEFFRSIEWVFHRAQTFADFATLNNLLEGIR